MSPVILGVIEAGLWLIGRLDREIRPGKREYMVILAASAAGDVLNGMVLGQGEFSARLSLSLLMGCLLLACITDVAICQVYNFVWWISGIASAVLLVCRGMGYSSVWEVLLFCMIQMVLFSRMYGKADCYAFCVCAVAEAGLGLGFSGFLCHMLVAFLLLAAVQAVQRNIGPRGRLKRPVPFLPYITAAFYLILTFRLIICVRMNCCYFYEKMP